ncbi:MAG: hypothetical protein U5Q44_08905 [Dehalococcoidia bacterium]|nr:hypothetical protein [Dehalococcoidia bacterium]
MSIAIGGVSFDGPEPLVHARLPYTPGLYMLGLSSGYGDEEAFEPLVVDHCDSLAEAVRLREARVRRYLWERPGALIWVASCPLSAGWGPGQRDLLVERVRRFIAEAKRRRGDWKGRRR